MVSGVAAGTATITATVDGKSATATITVLDGGVVSSSGATLSLQSGGVQIIVPADALLAATNLSVVPSTAFASDPRVVKGTPFDFGPSGTTFAKPVTVKIKYDPANLPQGTEEAALRIHLSVPGWQAVEGSTVDTAGNVVSAQVSHFSTYAILTPAPVAAVAVTLIPPAIQVGQTSQASAAMTDADGNVLTGRAVAWSSDNNSIASISTGGVVTALAPGTAQITGSSEGKSSSATLTVTPIPVASVTVSPATANVTAGSTQQLTAEAHDAGGALLAGRGITWQSEHPEIATVSPSGLVTAVTPGSATITATSEGKSGLSSITVSAVPVASLTVSPGSTTLDSRSG